jgi:hypothetical protein
VGLLIDISLSEELQRQLDIALDEGRKKYCFAMLKKCQANGNGVKRHCGQSRVARWFVFKPKIPIWINFGRP